MSHERFSSFTGMSLIGTFLVGAAAVTMLAGPATAAGPKCQAKMQRYDRAATAGGKDAKIAEAKTHRKSAAAALAKGSEKACLKYLELAQVALSQAQASTATDEPDKAE